MSAVICFGILCGLLFVGKMLRIAIPLFQRLYLPSSIIGGAVGLILFSCFPNLVDQSIITAIRTLPGFLINIVFATLFLGVAIPGLKRISNLAFSQLCFGQLVSWGQYVLGLGLVILILSPIFKVPAAFGNLLEIGFEGGHGTVGGLIPTFQTFNWTDGIVLGYTVATVGMVIGIVLGMVLINWAYRKKIVATVRSLDELSIHEKIGIYPSNNRPSAGDQTVSCDSIDSLAWHIAIVGIATFLGFGILKLLQCLEIFVAAKASYEPFLFQGFPLFPLCMFGGLIIQKILTITKQQHLIDYAQMQRLSGASLDFLVVAALSTITLRVVLDNLAPLLILIASGAALNICLVIYLAPKIFKDAWFERGIAEFGQSMGVTATGLLLLRTVDPENKTVAAEAFGCKQMFHEPIMGGGLWTAAALTLVFTKGIYFVFTLSLIGLVFWIIILLIFRKGWMK